jgi:uncharacterized protein YjbI with pentapeptide repeats
MKIECVGGRPVEIASTSLVGVRFDNLSLHRALLNDHDLRSASCVNANFRGAFVDANLCKADFNGASLIAASLM